MDEKRKRRRRKEPRVEPRSPVLVVSCPQCGGSVRDADLGERTKCQYCGTDLHLPTVDFTPDSPPSEPPRPRAAPVVELEREDAVPRPPPKTTFWVAYAAVVVGAVVAMLFVLGSSPTTEPARATPAPQSARDKELEGTMANANCTIDCNKPCLEISDPSGLVACLDKCEQKCKFVGKGTPSDCRSRCSSTCSGAPDSASRAACESGCMQGCPPG